MNQKRLSDAALRVRDVLYDGLKIREGMTLDEMIIQDRAGNLATAVIETLATMADERNARKRMQAAGEIEAGAVPQTVGVETTPAGLRYFEEDDPPPVRGPYCDVHKVAGECWGCDPAVKNIT